ncbi:MAG TPA: DUF2125 domain-containing protein [Ancylobacter sp.]
MSLPDVPLEAELPRRRRPWLVVLPVALFVVAGLAWTGAWFYASARAEQEIDAWIATEATKGRMWNCTDRKLGGFPFRFELMCDQPSVTFAGAGQWSWTAARAHAVAQVWNPQHIIAEFQGPARLQEATTNRQIEANWTLLQVSGVGAKGQLERLSISANDYTLAEGGTNVFAARHAEFHARHHPGDTSNTLDIAMGVKGATGLATGMPAGAPVDGEFQAMVSQVPEFRAMPVEERLRLWQAAGGRLTVEVAKLSAGGGVMSANGEIGLDPQRRPDGMLTLSLVNAPALLNALTTAGLMPAMAANIAPVLMAAGMPTTVDGANANSFPFVFRGGRVALGILPLGKIGPLF